MIEKRLPVKEDKLINLPLGVGMSIFLIRIVFTIGEADMVTIHETNLDEIDLLTLDMPAVKKGNTPWEPLYSFFTPKELNERAQEIAIQEIINQQIIFEALQYSLMASVGCGRTA